MDSNQLLLPEFLSHQDSGFRSLAMTLSDPVLNRTVFNYLVALAQDGQIELATNHLVDNFHFRARVLAGLTRTGARRTAVYHLPRMGTVRADQHQMTRRGLRLEHGNLPCLAISGGYIRRLMREEIFQRHQDRFPIELITVKELKPGAFAKYAHRWGPIKPPGSPGTDSPGRRSGPSAGQLTQPPSILLPSAAEIERPGMEPAEQHILANVASTEVEPQVEVRESESEPERELKNTQAELPAAKIGSESGLETKLETGPETVPETKANEWNSDNNGWEIPQPAIVPEHDSNAWNPNDNSWNELPKPTTVPEQWTRDWVPKSSSNDLPPKSDTVIPEHRNFQMKTNPRPLCDLAELERMNPVNDNRTYRQKWRGASPPERSRGRFGAVRQQRQSPNPSNRRPFSGGGFGNPSSSGFGVPSDGEERDNSPPRNRELPRNRTRNPGRNSRLRFTAEQEEYISDLLAEGFRKLRLDW